MAKDQAGYSKTQVGLHWGVVVLVAFQFLAHNAIELSWLAFRDGDVPPERIALLTYLHVAGGLLVLLLTLCRIYLRVTRGAPPPPADEPLVLKMVSDAVHHLIYALLVALPITGSAAWFIGLQPMAWLHSLLEQLLLVLIATHIAGALFQHLIRRSDVMMRMFAPGQ